MSHRIGWDSYLRRILLTMQTTAGASSARAMTTKCQGSTVVSSDGGPAAPSCRITASGEGTTAEETLIVGQLPGSPGDLRRLPPRVRGEPPDKLPKAAAVAERDLESAGTTGGDGPSAVLVPVAAPRTGDAYDCRSTHLALRRSGWHY
ncbi:hypothetical protein GCM10009664_63430 [Kitasatospora gansuensis]